MHPIQWQDFEKIDIRVGTIIYAKEFPEARKPAYQLTIDFGEQIGIKKSSAQITGFYKLNDLPGQQIIAVINFPPKKIAGFSSECLVLGIYTDDNDVVLLQPQRKTLNGLKIG